MDIDSLQLLENNITEQFELKLYLKREDLIHPLLSGNKWRKLKYNIEHFHASDYTKLLTFGGAYSNHIYAAANAGKHFGFKTIGIIRGERPKKLSPTLEHALTCGMQLHFVSRATYRLRNDEEYLNQLKSEFPDSYILPEGGTNKLAIEGCMEILDDVNIAYDYVCVSAGTGGTAAGIILNNKATKGIKVFSSLKGDFLKKDIRELIHQKNDQKDFNWELMTDYHFGGYAKQKPALIEFIKYFKNKFNVELERIYTGKMLYGVFDLIKKGYFEKGSTIIVVHTGGLQNGINYIR